MLPGMATFVTSPTEKFPVGTTAVGAYPLNGNTKLAQLGANDAPLGSATTTADVALDGTITFTGLADDTAYVAAKQINGVWQRVHFRTPKTVSALHALEPLWRTRRRLAGLA